MRTLIEERIREEEGIQVVRRMEWRRRAPGELFSACRREGTGSGNKFRTFSVNVQIRSITSDNDGKIGKMLRETPEFQSIHHMLDFWHVMKSLKKELRAVSLLKPIL